MTDYYVCVGDLKWEIGETNLCWLGEAVPGTAFASDVAAAAGAGGSQEVVVAIADRRAVSRAVETQISERPSNAYVATLLQIQAALDAA